jgi:hypothetical protein
MEEMAEDFLPILDVEEALLSGQVTQVEKDDPRGTKYVVSGNSTRSSNSRWSGWAFCQ